MAIQTYANLAQSTLASGYTAGNTTITVQTGDGALFPSTGNFTIAMNDPPDFFLLCTSRSTDTLTVSATGQEGTTAVNESSGTKVTQVISTAALNGIRADQCQAGVDASVPASAHEGTLYFTTDGFTVYRDTGSVLNPWGPLYPLVTPPTIASFTWVNQGGATATGTGGICITAPANSGTSLRMLVKTAPSTPYIIDAAFLFNLQGVNYQTAGLVFRDSGTGKISAFYFLCSNDNLNQTIRVTYYSSPTVAVTDQISFNISSPIFLRIADNGTNRIYSISGDGQHFTDLRSESNSLNFTADQVGFLASDSSNTFQAQATLISWHQH